MKIVHYLQCTGHGGDALNALMIAEAQQQQSHKVLLVAERAPHSKLFLDRAAAAGVPAIEATDLDFETLTSMPKRAWTLWRTLLPHKGDVLHLHTGGLLFRSADLVAARLLPFKVRVGTVQAPFDWSRYEHPEPHQRRWRQAAPLLHHILAPSALSLRFQVEAGLPRHLLAVQPNPVDIKRIAQGRRLVVREELGLPADALIVLFFSRLDDDKRPLDALRAFAAATKDVPNSYMLFAGSGSEEQICRAAARELGVAERVFFLGYRTDGPDLLHTADIFILPTKWESFGIAVAEAMAAGIPVITTPALVDVDVVQSEKTALVCPLGDVAVMAQAMRRLIDEPETRRRLGAKGKAAAQRFDAVLLARQHVDLYSRLLRRGVASEPFTPAATVTSTPSDHY